VRTVRVLVVGPLALTQIIQYLFHGRPEFEVVGSVSGWRSLGPQAGRLLPELIVANVKPVGIGVCRAVALIKRSSPLSKLILVCPIRDFMGGARKCGADAFLEQEKLVVCLLRTARSLSANSRSAALREFASPFHYRATRTLGKRGTQKGEVI
jgi:hypothetical protein